MYNVLIPSTNEDKQMTNTYDNAVLSHNEVMAEQVTRLRDALEGVKGTEWIVTAGGVTYFMGTQYRTNVLMTFNVLEAKKLGFGDAVRMAARLEDGEGNQLKAVSYTHLTLPTTSRV